MGNDVKKRLFAPSQPAYPEPGRSWEPSGPMVDAETAAKMMELRNQSRPAYQNSVAIPEQFTEQPPPPQTWDTELLQEGPMGTYGAADPIEAFPDDWGDWSRQMISSQQNPGGVYDFQKAQDMFRAAGSQGWRNRDEFLRNLDTANAELKPPTRRR